MSVDSNFNFLCGRSHGAGPPLPPSTCVHLSLTPSHPPCGRHKWMAPNATENTWTNTKLPGNTAAPESVSSHMTRDQRFKFPSCVPSQLSHNEYNLLGRNSKGRHWVSLNFALFSNFSKFLGFSDSNALFLGVRGVHPPYANDAFSSYFRFTPLLWIFNSLGKFSQVFPKNLCFIHQNFWWPF